MSSQNITLALLFTALISAHMYLQGMGGQSEEIFENSSFKATFQNWKQSMGRNYKSSSEEFYRLSVFKESFEKILEHEQLGETYTLGLTQFADMSDEEFRQTILMKTRDTRHGPNIKISGQDKYISGSVNWVEEGAVNPIQDQGACGSCYTFATAAATEGVSFLQTSNGLKKLSEQQLVSCSQSYGNDGCDGGFGQYSFQYVLEKGLMYESLYPYVSGEGKVPDCEVSHGIFYISSFRNAVGRGHCTAIQEQVSKQPVYGRVAVDARWKLYTGGIYKGKHCSSNAEDIDHAITIVGYNTESAVESQRYWIIRNSWGTSWGEQGYMKLEYGNSCSICYESFAPQY